MAPGSGLATILFTDLVGSTRMLDRLGDQAGDELLRRHFGILRQAVAAHHGREVKNLGDGLMVTFDDPASGAACAASMQRAISIGCLSIMPFQILRAES